MNKNNRQKVGQFVTLEKVTTGYRLWCRRPKKGINIKGAFYPTLKAATAEAWKVNAAILEGASHSGEEKREVERVLGNLKTIEAREGKIVLPVGSLPNIKTTHQVTFADLLEYGRLFLKLVEESNRAREFRRLTPYSAPRLLEILGGHLRTELEKALKPSMKSLIIDFVDHKCGPRGGRGRRELEENSKDVYRSEKGILIGWIGQLNSGDDQQLITNTLIESIDLARSTATKNKGKAISQQTKIKHARFARELGKYIVENKQGIWDRNIFSGLTDMYESSNNDKRPVVLNPEQVQKLFKVASKKENRQIIPYLTFIFFSSVRPNEMARMVGRKPNRKWQTHRWAQMKGWGIESTVSGGIRFEILKFVEGARMSKTKDRNAELFWNGLEWVKWWAKQEGKSLPKTGCMPFNESILRKVKKESGVFEGIETPEDIARHTCASFAHFNTDFKKPRDSYWREAFGHHQKTFDRHYKNLDCENQEACRSYFNILPPGVKPREGNLPLIKVV